MLDAQRSLHLALLLMMACSSGQGKRSPSAEAASEPQRSLGSLSDSDSLLAGTYQLTLTGVPPAGLAGSLVGTLVLSAKDIPTRVNYLHAQPVRGCLLLRGTLSLLGPEIDTSRTSFATFIGLSPTSDGWLKTHVYAGVDYGYSLRLAIRQGRLEGTGRSYSPSTPQPIPYATTLTGTRTGPLNLGLCQSLFREDSLLGAHSR